MNSKHLLSFALGLAPAGTTALIVVSHYQTEKFFDDPSFSKHKDLEPYYQAFEKDLQFLDEQLQEEDWSRNKDAQDFLSLHINRYTKEEKKRVTIAVNGDKQSRSWESISRYAKTSDLQLNWLNELKKFDHWNFLSAAESQESLSKVSTSSSIEKVEAWAVLEIPDYLFLRHLAVLNILKHKGQPTAARQGMETYLHIAKLMASSSTLVGQSVAAAMFSRSTELAKFVGLSNPYSEQIAIGEAYRRVSWGWAHVIRSEIFSGKISARWQPYLKYHLGLCAGVAENAVGVEAIGDFFYPHTVFERDLRQRLDTSKRLYADLIRRCGLEELDVFMVRTPNSARPLIWGDESNALWSMFGPSFSPLPNPIRVPYVRRLFGTYLMSVATPDYISGVYREQVAKPSSI